MARKKIDIGGEDELKKQELCKRVLQIRQTFFGDNNREFSIKIGVNEQSLSQICSGGRFAGIEVVQRIVENMSDIDANWLLVGKGDMLRIEAKLAEKLQPVQAALYEKMLAEKDMRCEELIRENERLRLENVALKDAASRYATREGGYSPTTIHTES